MKSRLFLILIVMFVAMPTHAQNPIMRKMEMLIAGEAYSRRCAFVPDANRVMLEVALIAFENDFSEHLDENYNSAKKALKKSISEKDCDDPQLLPAMQQLVYMAQANLDAYIFAAEIAFKDVTKATRLKSNIEEKYREYELHFSKDGNLELTGAKEKESGRLQTAKIYKEYQESVLRIAEARRNQLEQHPMGRQWMGQVRPLINDFVKNFEGASGNSWHTRRSAFVLASVLNAVKRQEIDEKNGMPPCYSVRLFHRLHEDDEVDYPYPCAFVREEKARIAGFDWGVIVKYNPDTEGDRSLSDNLQEAILGVSPTLAIQIAIRYKNSQNPKLVFLSDADYWSPGGLLEFKFKDVHDGWHRYSASSLPLFANLKKDKGIEVLARDAEEKKMFSLSIIEGNDFISALNISREKKLLKDPP